MMIGKVVGNIWATRKEENLVGLKFLIIQPVDGEGNPSAATLVAADRIGAGTGELVLVTTGSSARKALPGEERPVDATVIGIIDEVELVRSRLAGVAAPREG